MTIAVPKEAEPGETRTVLVPSGAATLVKLGAEVEVESGLGTASGHADADYQEAGAIVRTEGPTFLRTASVVLRLHPPPMAQAVLYQSGSVQISFLDPFHRPALLSELAARGVSALSLELLPRITRAQAMDALSSQANLAGYVAVMLAAERLNRILPMMTTAAGTFAPARVLVLGVGVAGLQAIATAHRLGAMVSAYDTRVEVEEQVRSLGARFLRIDLGQTGSTAEGYAKALTRPQLDQLRSSLVRHCAEADVVIAAAQVFGRRAPLLVTRDAIGAMKPGSIVVDLAVTAGGNVEGITANQITIQNGVTLIAWSQLAARVPATASQALSANLTRLIEEVWDSDHRRLELRLADEIVRGCLVTHAGKICHPLVLERLGEPQERTEKP